jgi:hypothetical protein
MNARRPIKRNVKTLALTSALLTLVCFDAVAASTATLEQRDPLPATLMPSLKVTASIANPSAPVRWSMAPTRPVAVTLMPTLTVTADVDAVAVTTLPTITVIAQIESSQFDAAPALAISTEPAQVPAQAVRESVLGVMN